MLWLKHDLEGRTKDMARLLALVKLPLLSPQVLMDLSFTYICFFFYSLKSFCLTRSCVFLIYYLEVKVPRIKGQNIRDISVSLLSIHYLCPAYSVG